ncbi:MAG: hypothetical protein R6U32_04975 [Candidatus Woesearchaeota archaeon]
MNKRCFGGNHTPEKKLLKSKTRWVDADERKKFEKDYRKAVNEGIIMREKKRTKKGSDWHISLNPRMKKEIIEALGW